MAQWTDRINCIEKKLVGHDFSDQNLDGYNFSGADLRGANFNGASLKCANFNGANLVGARLTDITIEFTSFDRANMKNVMFGEGEKEKFWMSDCSFVQTNFSGAKFNCSIPIDKLATACLRGSNLDPKIKLRIKNPKNKKITMPELKVLASEHFDKFKVLAE